MNSSPPPADPTVAPARPLPADQGSQDPLSGSGRIEWLEALVVAAGTIVAATGLWSLVLAQIGRWNPTTVAGGSLVAGAVIGRRLYERRATMAPSPRALLVSTLIISIGLLAVVLPGNRVSFAGTDPGVYVQITRELVETGDLGLADPVAELDLAGTAASSVFPGLHPSPVREGRLDFMFYHLYPALAAPAYALGRTLGLSLISPMLGVLGAAASTLVMYRLRGLAAAIIAGGFLASSFIWTFYADWNGSELPTAVFGLLALLAALIAWDTDAADAAVAAGFLAGVAANSRADGLLLILVAAGVASSIIVAGRARLAVAGFAGLAPAAAVWAVQTYNTSVEYATNHFVPGPGTIMGLIAAMVVGATAARRWLAAWSGWDRVFRWLFPIGAGVYVAVLVGFWVRSQVSEPGSTAFEDYPSWYPFAAERLVWFLGPVALVLFLLGFAELGRSRSWRALAMIAPGLIVLPLYLWEQRVTAHMIWAMRRFLPLVWPTAALMVGLGVAFAARWAAPRLTAGFRSVAVAVVLAAVVIPQLMWTVPLRGLREWSGGFALPDELAADYGDAVYVWVAGASRNAFAVPLIVERRGGVVTVGASVTTTELDLIGTRVAPVPVVVLADTPEQLIELGVPDPTVYRVGTERLEYTWDRIPTEIEHLDLAVAAGLLG
ncbi:MAG: hypothetical protein ACK5PP_04405 [Acidimicrobiales bacterium]